MLSTHHVCLIHLVPPPEAVLYFIPSQRPGNSRNYNHEATRTSDFMFAHLCRWRCLNHAFVLTGPVPFLLPAPVFIAEDEGDSDQKTSELGAHCHVPAPPQPSGSSDQTRF